MTVILKEQNESIESETTQPLNDKEAHQTVFSTKNLNLWYGDNHALKDVNLDFHEKEISAIIGPSGCGKSTFIKALNRMVELVPNVRIEGEVLYRDTDILNKKQSLELLRTKVGMVFQKPNPFPKSIYENVAYGPKIH